MAQGPLVVMTRPKGERGWMVHLNASSVRIADTVITSTGNGRVRLRPDGARGTHGLGEAFTLGTLEVVCFRSEEKTRAAPTARVMKAIEVVRASDSEDARRVLSDVLEESGALAEAEYVRLELKLQTSSDVASSSFIDGVQQLRALSSVVGPTFRYLVGRDIDGCGGVRWAFRCPASWDGMKATAKPDERVCVSCRQVVVQVTTEHEAATLAREGVCAHVRVQEREPQRVGEMAAPPRERGGGPQWVGSVAVGPGPRPDELQPPTVSPKKEEEPAKEKSWWRRLFGG